MSRRLNPDRARRLLNDALRAEANSATPNVNGFLERWKRVSVDEALHVALAIARDRVEVGWDRARQQARAEKAERAATLAERRLQLLLDKFLGLS